VIYAMLRFLESNLALPAGIRRWVPVTGKQRWK
jgi:hypothetical protein